MVRAIGSRGWVHSVGRDRVYDKEECTWTVASNSVSVLELMEIICTTEGMLALTFSQSVYLFVVPNDQQHKISMYIRQTVKLLEGILTSTRKSFFICRDGLSRQWRM